MATGPLTESTDGDNKIDGTILFVVSQLQIDRLVSQSKVGRNLFG